MKGTKKLFPHTVLELPWWLTGKESTYNAGDSGDWDLIPESGRFPGGGHCNPLQYSCLENPMDRGAWRAIVCEVAGQEIQNKRPLDNSSIAKQPRPLVAQMVQRLPAMQETQGQE
ncbi:hypothetical protein R6Z07M_004632 [Ovis aries]